MTPYYSDDSVTIYHGDSREIALALAFDAVVTDPPYGIDYERHASSNRLGSSITGRVVGDAMAFDPAWVLDLGKPTVLWGANHYASRLPSSPSWLVWDKRVRNNVGVNMSGDGEMAWSNLGGPMRIFRHMWNGMWRDSERGLSYHPTQKPVALMRWVLARCPEGMTVDPYMGAGSTLVAAKSLNRRAIGIEIEERYCEIAATRCSQEVLGLVG